MMEGNPLKVLLLFLNLALASQSTWACVGGHGRVSPNKHVNTVFVGMPIHTPTSKETRRFQVLKAFKGAVMEDEIVDVSFDEWVILCGGYEPGENETAMIFADGNGTSGGSLVAAEHEMAMYHAAPWEYQSELDAYREKIRAVKSGLANASNSITLLNELSVAQEGFWDFTNLIRTLERLRELEPANQEYLSKRAMALLHLGRSGEALEIAERVLKVDSQATLARKVRIVALILQGRTKAIPPDSRDLSDMKLPTLDLHGWDLAGVDFSGSEFGEGTRFEKTELSRASFVGADLAGVNFRSARLAGSDFSEATILRSDFTGAFLDGAKLSGVRVVRDSQGFPATLEVAK